MATWYLAHQPGSWHCLAHARSPRSWLPLGNESCIGATHSPPSGGGVSPDIELSLSFSSFCLLCWLGSKSSWPRTILLNRDWNVRNSCAVFIPRLISPTNGSSAWQPWVQLGLTVSLSSCAFQTVLFLSLLSDDPSRYSGDVAVFQLFSGFLGVLCTSVLLYGRPKSSDCALLKAISRIQTTLLCHFPWTLISSPMHFLISCSFSPSQLPLSPSNPSHLNC